MIDGSNATSRRRWGRWFYLVGILLITSFGWYFGFHHLAGLVRGAHPLPLLLMAVLIIAGFWIRAWKWHLALGPGNQGVLLFFIAKTAGNWTPGRAGELAPLLLKQHRNARVAAWIGLDRVVEVVWTLGLGLAGAASLGLVSTSAWAGLLAVAASGCVALAFVWRLNGHGGPRATQGATPSGRQRVRHAAGRLCEEIIVFRTKLPIIVAVTLVAKLTDIYAVLLLCEAFGYRAGFLLVCAARCAHGLVSAIPVTPDATGAPFIAAAWLLHACADIPYDTLTAALALELIAINGILWACFCLVTAGRWKPFTNGKSTT